jgi:hypothetical protein
VKIAFKLLLTSRNGGRYPSTGAIDLRGGYVSSASADFGWQRQIWRERRRSVQRDLGVRSHVFTSSRLEYEHLWTRVPLAATTFRIVTDPGVVDFSRLIYTILKSRPR